MKYYLYILESEITGKLYIGQSNDLEDRLYRHNTNQSIATKGKGPWKLIYSLEFGDRAAAMQLEKKLKNWKSSVRVREWITRNQ